MEGYFLPRYTSTKNWFRFYSAKFNTIELNVTFYRFPVISSLGNWYNISPDNFSFTVKVPRLITHYKKFSDCSRLIDDFYNLVTKGLREKLGALLFQLPPKYIYTNERRDRNVKSMYKEFKNVIEFRDKTWWCPAVISRFKKENLIFCGIDYPGLPNDPVMTTKTVYYRFHGKPRLYYSAYKKDELNKIGDTILANKKVYVFFNNTATAAALKNAIWLDKHIRGQLIAG